MRQHIYEDEFGADAWELDATARCFVTILNSADWQAVTGEAPPTRPPTSREYTRAGLPWFDYYADRPALAGSTTLGRLKSVFTLGSQKGETPLPGERVGGAAYPSTTRIRPAPRTRSEPLIGPIRRHVQRRLARKTGTSAPAGISLK